MKFNFFIILLITSCSGHHISDKKSVYSAKGFALISNLSMEDNNSSNFYAFHEKFNVGTKIRINNPENKKFLELKIKKKIAYDKFYKIMINENVAKELDLNLNFPYVEVTEIKRNKSFVAKKAVTNIEEKIIANKAPIEQININNISKKTNIKKPRKKNFSILVAEFYSMESAVLLKKKLATILNNSNYQLVYVKKNSEKSYELLMGPYNTINKLKNDYITLTDSNFEDLDIQINE